MIPNNSSIKVWYIHNGFIQSTIIKITCVPQEKSAY
jgi:hypothetical protein